MLKPEEIAQYIDDTYQKNPFVQVCDIKMEYAKCGEVCLSIELDDKHTNIYGAAHGGALATLIDTAMGVCGASVGSRIVTLNLNINYISSIYFCDKAVATATMVHNGMSTMVCDVVVKNGKGEVVTTGTGTLFVIGKFDEIPEKW